jgi:hypothetical protein
MRCVKPASWRHSVTKDRGDRRERYHLNNDRLNKTVTLRANPTANRRIISIWSNLERIIDWYVESINNRFESFFSAWFCHQSQKHRLFFHGHSWIAGGGDLIVTTEQFCSIPRFGMKRLFCGRAIGLSCFCIVCPTMPTKHNKMILTIHSYLRPGLWRTTCFIASLIKRREQTLSQWWHGFL